MWKQCYFQAKLYSKLFIAFKISYSCCLGFRGNLDFPDFLQKSFITLTSGWWGCYHHRKIFSVLVIFVSSEEGSARQKLSRPIQGENSGHLAHGSLRQNGRPNQEQTSKIFATSGPRQTTGSRSRWRQVCCLPSRRWDWIRKTLCGISQKWNAKTGGLETSIDGEKVAAR